MAEPVRQRHEVSEAGIKLQRMIKRTRQYLFVFVTNREFQRPTTAPNAHCAPASCSEKSPMVSAPSGELSSTPTSALSSKPPAAVPSEPSKQSLSPSPERRWCSQHSRREASNYDKRGDASDQVDAVVVPVVLSQRGPSSASCAFLQQLSNSSRSAPGLSVTAAMSPSNWPRSPCRRCCSRDPGTELGIPAAT